MSDGCLLRILEGLMTLKLRGGERERLSYRTLDVEQIGWVYETVMGFTVEAAQAGCSPSRPARTTRRRCSSTLDELLGEKGQGPDQGPEGECRAQPLTAAQAKAVEAADAVDELAAALDRDCRRARLATPRNGRRTWQRRSCSRPMSGGAPAATTRRAS